MNFDPDQLSCLKLPDSCVKGSDLEFIISSVTAVGNKSSTLALQVGPFLVQVFNIFCVATNLGITLGIDGLLGGPLLLLGLVPR